MTVSTRTQLARQALEKSLEVREEYGYDFRSPLCVYDLSDCAGVKVQFVNDVSMEGVYAALAKPTILLSSLRPLARRAFTCAHELGHHVFGHGSTIDELRDGFQSGMSSSNEFLADTFAGFILMPAQGVKRAFSTRGLAATTATPEDIYTVASSFGVGYETIIGVVHAGKHGQCCCANSRPCRGTWCVSALARFPVCSFGVVAQVPSMVSDTKLDSKSFLSSRTSHR